MAAQGTHEAMAQATVQAQTGETRIDYNALDNTTAGRGIQAGLIAAFIASPVLLRPVVVAAGLATVAAFNAFDEDPRNDLTAFVDTSSAPPDSPAATWGKATVAAAGIVLAARTVRAAQKAAEKTLFRRGVRRPRATLALLVGGVTFAATEIAASVR